jgi:hypothetical protein
MEVNNPQKLILKNKEEDNINKNNDEQTKNEDSNNANNQVTTNTPMKQEIPDIIENEEEEINYD